MLLRKFCCLLAFSLAAACGGSSDPAPGGDLPAPTVAPTPEPTPAPTPEPTPGEPDCDAKEYESTWEGVQDVIFAGSGCNVDACHGSNAAGGLDLSPEVAWENIFEAESVGSDMRLVEPGDKDRSYLWLKVAAKTDPEGDWPISGGAMPTGGPAIAPEALEALRLWIYGGGSETGVVEGTAELLGACLPDPEPITVKPLDAPDRDEGVQLVMPPVPLPRASEQEVCFATYYDFTDRVPERFLDPTKKYFRIDTQELRQDPLSHHLVLIAPEIPEEDYNHPRFGGWACVGGASEGESCEPTDLEFCGEGQCVSAIDRFSLGCVGYGPPSAGIGVVTNQAGGAQEAQAYQELRAGVFAQMPLKGILYWSSHAFNLTQKDHVLNGRLNFLFAEEQEFPLQTIFDVSGVWDPDAAPFTTQEVCGEYVVPPGTRLFGMTSHTHQRGKEFRAWAPDGTQIFENFLYNDPVKQRFDPPLEFDSEDPAERTIRYCALYNNGVNPDGSPNAEEVTRQSRVPASALATSGNCDPVACVNDGMVGEPCDDGIPNYDGNDAACDSSPGAGDGFCDACPITGGESTENEMFILFGTYFIDPAYPQPPVDGAIWLGLG